MTEIGMNNYAAANTSVSKRGTQEQVLHYKVNTSDKGRYDTLDGIVANVVNENGDDALKNDIALQFSKAEGLGDKADSWAEMSPEQQEAALLRFAARVSDDVARDSGIQNPNVINPGQELNLNILTHLKDAKSASGKSEAYQGGLLDTKIASWSDHA